VELMPDLLIELRSEEIPARMQRKAAGDLRKAVTDALVDAGLTYEGAREYWTPRRLTLDMRGVTPRSKPTCTRSARARSTDAPEKALAGLPAQGRAFLRLRGGSAHRSEKGRFLRRAIISKPGRDAEAIIAEVMPGIIRGFPGPNRCAGARPRASRARSMGAAAAVDPLHLRAGDRGAQVIDFEVDGLVAGNTTSATASMRPTASPCAASTIMRRKARACPGRARRRAPQGDHRLRRAQSRLRAGLELVEDEGLLDEVSGLVEWPVVLMGEFEEDFLEIPDEVMRLTIKTNQKCFVCREPGNGS
jgi:glycyl-tRNA synthetase beta chain